MFVDMCLKETEILNKGLFSNSFHSNTAVVSKSGTSFANFLKSCH